MEPIVACSVSVLAGKDTLGYMEKIDFRLLMYSIYLRNHGVVPALKYLENIKTAIGSLHLNKSFII